MTSTNASLPTPDLQTAAAIIETARAMVGKGVRTLAATGGPDVQQVLAYDLAHAASAVETARSMLDYGAKGNAEGLLACAFTADMVHDLISRLIGREKLWGVNPADLAHAHDFVATFRDPEFLASLASTQGPRHLDSDFEMVQDTFRAFANKEVAPRAEHVHRFNEDVPE
ncbi:MAG: acyl-CoA dehydrogenase, partial [Actinobacteria bacterium]|nr:acyl-CoA dehydrogenase [Actinomycetota bacterium]